MPARRWDVEHLDLHVTLFPDDRRIEGVATHTIAPLRDHDTLILHQEGLSFGEISVDGTVVEARVGDGLVEIPVAPGERHEVRIAYSAEPELGMFFRSKASGYSFDEVWTQGEDEENRFWIPLWDHPNDLFTVSTTVTAPKRLVVRSNGALKDQTTTEGQTTWTFALEQPIVSYLIALVAGEYQVVTQEARVPVEILGSRREKAQTLVDAVGQVPQMLPFYEELLGTPYPYPVYRTALVQGFLYGGMENPTLTTITDERIQNVPERASRIESIVAHELAHHWFGDLITCYGWRELWLNEGFATYYEKRWKEHAYGPEHDAASWHRTRGGALRLKEPMSARAHSKIDGHRAGVYVRGSSVLRALEIYLGRDLFDATIRQWVAQNQHQLVEGEDLRRLFEDASGEHLGWLFDQWVTGAGTPTWITETAYDDGKMTLTLTPEEDELFYTPVEVEIGSDPVQTAQIWLGEGATTLVLPLKEAPRWVTVDPRGGVIGVFDQNQSTASWTAQLRHSPSPLARIHAMQALKGKDSASATEALGKILNGELDSYFRIHAAAVLATHPNDASRSALLQALSDDNAYVRESAVKALREHEPTSELRSRLLQVHQNDPDVYTRARALKTLSTLEGPKVLSSVRDRLKRVDNSRVGREHIEALDQLMKHGTLEDARAALRFLDVQHARYVRGSAVDTIAHLIYEADDSPQKRALQRVFVRRLEPMLQHPDLRVRQRVVRGFRAVHPEDRAPLRRFIRTSDVQRERQAARRILEARDKRQKTEAVDELEERIEALEGRFEGAEGRLDALEEWRR